MAPMVSKHMKMLRVTDQQGNTNENSSRDTTYLCESPEYRKPRILDAGSVETFICCCRDAKYHWHSAKQLSDFKNKIKSCIHKIVIMSSYVSEGTENLCPHKNLKIESDCNRFIHNCQNVETNRYPVVSKVLKWYTHTLKYSMMLNSSQIIRITRHGNLKYVVLSEWSYNQWHSAERRAGKTWCMMLSSQIHVTAQLPKHRMCNAKCELWCPLGRCCPVNMGSLTITGPLWWRGDTDNKEVIHALDWSSMWSPYLSNLLLTLKKTNKQKNPPPEVSNITYPGYFQFMPSYSNQIVILFIYCWEHTHGSKSREDRFV